MYSNRPLHYIREADGSVRAVASLQEWAQHDSSQTYRIAENTVGSLWVSTVFLGIDHQWGDGPPILYETMVFRNEPDPELGTDRTYEDLEMERYATEAEALAGHERIVAQARALAAEDAALVADAMASAKRPEPPAG